MRTRVRALLAAVVLLLATAVAGASGMAPGGADPSPVEAELVLRGAAVCTMDRARSWAEAVAVHDGRIVYVGDADGVKAYIGPATRVLNLQGRMVLPGFTDAHCHPAESGIDMGNCDLNACGTRAEIEAAVRRYASAHPERPWVVGAGWQLPLFPGANPSRKLLDRLVPGRPAFMNAADGHSAWVNTRALELAGIRRGTPDPVGGRIERDAHGDPTGTLRESAVELVFKLVPKPTPDEVIEGVRRALKLAASYGVTSMQDANAAPHSLPAYKTLDDRGELTARMRASLCADPDKDASQVDALVALRDQYQGRLFRASTVKIFADGVLEDRTAAVLQPYVDRGGRGHLNFDEPLLKALVARLDREGFQVHVHAIGDRAVRAALDAFAAGARSDRRHQIAHLQLVDPQDIPRFRRLGVIADVQGFWAEADEYVTKLTDPGLGPKRAARQYPIASLFRSGAVVVGGSDWSVSTLNPLDAIQVAVTRRPLNDPKAPAWIPTERADLMDMLAAYTINGAYVQGVDDISGSIEAGKSADLIVLDHNLFEIPPAAIHKTRVLLTLLEGREVYRR